MLPNALEEDVAASEALQQLHRTTLVLAWWRGDPRGALPKEKGLLPVAVEPAGASTAPERSGSCSSSSRSSGGGSNEVHWLRPMMLLPRTPVGEAREAGTGAGELGSRGGSSQGGSGAALGAEAGWLRDLWLRPGEWEEYEAAAADEVAAVNAAPAGQGGSAPRGPNRGGLLAVGEVMCPCWVSVAGPPSGEGKGLQGAGQDAACVDELPRHPPLPPLRFFLPDASAIAAAYPPTAGV